MKKSLAAVVAVVLGLGGAVSLGVSSASAHDHTDSISCPVATVDLANYDGAATVKVTLDDVVVHDTAPFGGQYHFSQALTYDASHTSHTLKVDVVSQDPGYSFSHTDTTPANCYTPPKGVPILPVVVHAPTCTSGVTYDVPFQNADVKYALESDGVTRPVPGNGFTLAAGQTLTISAHVTAEAVANGDAPNDYTVTITGGNALHNASCVPPQPCTITGAAYHEADDHAGVLTPSGIELRSFHDGKATDYILPATGNLQGIGTLTYTDSNVVGNGIFVRFIVDLSADGGSSYNSLSVLGNTVSQASVADVGSKNVFLGKTIAQIADLYPDAKYTGISWQTGSAYAAGDGATLTGYSGMCGTANFVPTVPNDTHRSTDTNGETVCTAGGVGGGSYTETVTNFTSTPVWNETTMQYDMVETMDAGYPVETTHTTPASLESCPTHAKPVDPSVAAVCDKDDTVTFATTAGITYSTLSSDAKGMTVLATPADATVLDGAEGWTISEDGTATFQVVYDNSGCPIALTNGPNGLAFTGSDPTALIFFGASALFLGLGVFFSIQAYRRREAAVPVVE